MSVSEPDIERFAERFESLVNFVPLGKNELHDWYEQAEGLRAERVFGDVPHFVHHYLSDADIRMKDEVYAEMQNSRIATFLTLLRSGIMPNDDDV